jgi:hypothetical protein
MVSWQISTLAIVTMIRVGIETEMKVNQLQEEVKDLRQQIAVMNQQAFNVLLFILAVIVALVLWK